MIQRLPKVQRWLVVAMLLLAAFWPIQAGADDISATARGVVRVVTIQIADGQVTAFGHGSGIAVAPNRILTNAHVVKLAADNPQGVVIGVVPSEGSKPFEAKIIAYDAQRDLALIEFDGIRLPVGTFYSGGVDDGSRVTALGYPGNVDLATAQSAKDYITPAAPIRSEGVFSARRSLAGVEVLLHTANIARGNSGGPLLDPCGRVIGINSAITKNQEGDSTFGFAISDKAVFEFLKQAQQPYLSVASPCTSLDAQISADRAADAAAAEKADAARREAAAKSEAARADALVKARAQAERLSQNVMAVAALMLVLGALAVGAAGLLLIKGGRIAAVIIALLGVGTMIGAVIVFINRPTPDTAFAPTFGDPVPIPTPMAGGATGKMICTFLPGRSRLTVSSAKPVPIDWSATGCMNGRTQYVEGNGRWTKIIVPTDDQTVSVLQYDPLTHTFATLHYFLNDQQMDQLRKLGSAGGKSCGASGADLKALSNSQDALSAALPASPNEKLVFDCQPAK